MRCSIDEPLRMLRSMCWERFTSGLRFSELLMKVEARDALKSRFGTCRWTRRAWLLTGPAVCSIYQRYVLSDLDCETYY